MDVAAIEEVVTTERINSFRNSEQELATGRPGVQMFFAAPTQSSMKNPIQGDVQEIKIYHKTFAGLITPFDLPIEFFPEYLAMLEKDPSAVKEVNAMIRGAVAESTAKS